MNNPNGPYPGRQLFLGTTVDGRRAFAYLVTGRSPASPERKATVRENSRDIEDAHGDKNSKRQRSETEAK